MAAIYRQDDIFYIEMATHFPTVPKFSVEDKYS